MEVTGQMKMARFQTFWIQMRKNKPLDESHKTDQTSGTKMAFYSNLFKVIIIGVELCTDRLLVLQCL
ncbi:hypothetical protein Hanom_Chr13g01217061 [Helianthus anomalus]